MLDIEEVKRLAESGITQSDAYRKLCVSAATMSVFCKKNNILFTRSTSCGIPDRKPEYYKDLNDPIILDYLNGRTFKQLAVIYYKTNSSIESYIRRRRVNKIHKNIEKLSPEIFYNHLLEGKTYKEIANHYNVDSSHINKLVERLNIDSHSSNYAKAEKISGKKLNIEEIDNLYWVDRKTSLDIAKIYGFVGDEAIRSFMKINNIPIRAGSWHDFTGDKTQYLFAIQCLNNKEWLLNEYSSGLSTYEIGDKLLVSGNAVLSAFKKLGIEPKSHLEYINRRRLGKPHQNLITHLDSKNIKHLTAFIYKGSYNDKDRTFEIDEFLPEKRMFVEVQGLYWHGYHNRTWKNPNTRSKLWSDLIKYLCVTRDYPDCDFVYINENQIKNGSFKEMLEIENTTIGYTEIAVNNTPYLNENEGDILRLKGYKIVGMTDWDYFYTDDNCAIIKKDEAVDTSRLYKMPIWPKLIFKVMADSCFKNSSSKKRWRNDNGNRGT